MDADTESGRCGDAESHVGEYAKEVGECIFYRGLSKVRSLGGGPRTVISSGTFI